MRREEKLCSIFVLCVCIRVCRGLKPFQLRYKISKAHCSPVQGFENHILPCYDFQTKKLVDPSDCSLKKNKHCCMYNCRCIIRGAGTVDIPEAYRLRNNKLISQFNLIKGCVTNVELSDNKSNSSAFATTLPKNKQSTTPANESTRASTTTTTPTYFSFEVASVQPSTLSTKESRRLTTISVSTKMKNKSTPLKKRPTPRKTFSQIASKTSLGKKPKNQKDPSRVKISATKASTIKSKIKQPMARKGLKRQAHPKRPSNRKPNQYNKPLKLSSQTPSHGRGTKEDFQKTTPTAATKIRKVKPTKKTNHPCTTTRRNQQSFSFNFFSRMANILNGIGFNYEVEPNDDC
uniref:uncharacterized protein LOC120341535 n=1 Tax=Styela clava TaxID=7725 RepID=UPI00193A5A2E|nr:uncharacterized protein LOC120341535 [Styela clava]